MTFPFMYFFLGLMAFNVVTGLLFGRKPSETQTKEFVKQARYNGANHDRPLIQGTQAYTSHFV